MSLRLFSIFALSAFALIAPPLSQAQLAATSVQAAIDTSPEASQDLPFTLTVDHLAGLAAWLPVGKYFLKANSTEDTTVTITYTNDPFVATFHIRAELLGMHQGHEQWQITVVRQDAINNVPSGAPRSSKLVLDRGGPGILLITKGHYGIQERNLRLGFTLN